MKKRDGYGPNPADGPKLDEYGNLVKPPKPPTNKGSSDAEKGRSELRAKLVDKKLARKEALKKMLEAKKNAKYLTKIPASPTR